MNPRLAFSALILSSHNNQLIGNGLIWTDEHPIPTGADETKRIAARITERAHRDGDLPAGQHYVVTGWSLPGPVGAP